MSLVFNMVGGGGNGGGIKLTGIAITKAPLKTAYKAGEAFDAAGMVVTATYSNGAKLDNPAYTVAPSGALAVGTTTVTISYSEGGVTKTATQKISVTRTALRVPSQSGSLTYTGGELSPEWNNYAPEKMKLGGVTSGTNAGSYNAIFTIKNTALYCWPDGSTAAKTVAWTIGKAAGTLTLSKTEVTLKPDTTSDTFTVTTNSTGAVSVESGAPDTVSAKLDGDTVTVTSVGNKSGTAIVTVSVAGDDNHTAPASKTCSVKCSFATIYGVFFDWQNNNGLTKGVRTDMAAGFADPSPAVGNGTGSSPFDDLMPWSGMVKEEDPIAGTLVKIPKFWFKWETQGKSIGLKIAAEPTEGFHTSPAHADRGDGKGERDYVYIGRYHCNGNYRSVGGDLPGNNMTRAQARAKIHNLGADYWQSGIQMRITIWMLYLVEFADWNSQKTIGYGCSFSGSLFNMGVTDRMQYHTGTTVANRTDYGYTQYRYIDGLWDNVFDWMDGCYYNDSGLNIINTPSKFNDTSNGVVVGVPSSGFPSTFSVSTKSGLKWAIYPTAAGGSETTYSADGWYFGSSYPCLFVGGYYNRDQNSGLFYVSCNWSPNILGYIGCRLQKLP